MKKIKKSLAVVLSLIMAIAVLSACTSTEATQKPTEEDPKPTEEVVTTTTEVEPTEEPTATTEPTEEPTTTVATPEPEGDVIIPLWSYTSDMLAVPNDYATLSQFDMNMFISYYDLAVAEETYYSTELLELSGITEDFRVAGYAHGATTGEVYDADFYISADDDNRPCVWFVIDGEYYYRNNLIPLYYNQTRNCFIAYNIDRETETVELVELYCNVDSTSVSKVTVDDPSVYGL